MAASRSRCLGVILLLLVATPGAFPQAGGRNDAPLGQGDASGPGRGGPATATVTAATRTVQLNPLIGARYLQILVRHWKLGDWQKEEGGIAASWNSVRDAVLNRLSHELFKMKITHRRFHLRNLPIPSQNRIVLSLLASNAGFLPTLGEQVAFMARVVLDQGTVKWVQSDGGTDIGAVTTHPPGKQPPYDLNCNQFIQYCAYLTGLPRDSTDHVPSAHKGLISPQHGLITNNVIQGWEGWWKPVYNTTTGDPLRYDTAGYGIGDLVVLFTNSTVRVGWTQPRVITGMEFFHVEIVTEPSTNHNDTKSIGNSGEAPHFSHLFGRLRRLGQWIGSDNLFTHIRTTATQEWRYVIFDFQESLRPVPGATVELGATDLHP